MILRFSEEFLRRPDLWSSDISVIPQIRNWPQNCLISPWFFLSSTPTLTMAHLSATLNKYWMQRPSNASIELYSCRGVFCVQNCSRLDRSRSRYARRSFIHSAVASVRVSYCRVTNWKSWVASCKCRVASLKSRVASCKCRVASLKSRVASCKCWVASWKSRVASRSRVTSCNCSVASWKSRLTTANDRKATTCIYR